jgi:hypothetical protein
VRFAFDEWEATGVNDGLELPKFRG